MKKKIYYSKEKEPGEPFLLKLKDELKNVLGSCKKIAIKIHFGEPGNDFAFNPEHIKPIIDLLKELKISYFLYDSSVAYGGERGNPESHIKYAIKKGWGKLGEIKTDDDFFLVNGRKMNYEVSKSLIEADGVLVITHFKGHVCCGFGGAIKNLGMGALTKKTKSAIHHGGEPNIIGECKKCKKCEDACPLNGIKVIDKPEIERCYGCSNCIYACPHKILKPKLEFFDVLLAEGANAAQSKFKKTYYLSYLINITKECDCERNPKKIISDNCGYLMGEDGVSIDKAAYDILLKNNKEDVFKKYNKKSGIKQIKAAEHCGMGSSVYELINL